MTDLEFTPPDVYFSMVSTDWSTCLKDRIVVLATEKMIKDWISTSIKVGSFHGHRYRTLSRHYYRSNPHALFSIHLILPHDIPKHRIAVHVKQKKNTPPLKMFYFINLNNSVTINLMFKVIKIFHF